MICKNSLINKKYLRTLLLPKWSSGSSPTPIPSIKRPRPPGGSPSPPSFLNAGPPLLPLDFSVVDPSVMCGCLISVFRNEKCIPHALGKIPCKHARASGSHPFCCMCLRFGWIWAHGLQPSTQVFRTTHPIPEPFEAQLKPYGAIALVHAWPVSALWATLHSLLSCRWLTAFPSPSAALLMTIFHSTASLPPPPPNPELQPLTPRRPPRTIAVEMHVEGIAVSGGGGTPLLGQIVSPNPWQWIDGSVDVVASTTST